MVPKCREEKRKIRKMIVNPENWTDFIERSPAASVLRACPVVLVFFFFFFSFFTVVHGEGIASISAERCIKILYRIVSILVASWVKVVQKNNVRIKILESIDRFLFLGILYYDHSSSKILDLVSRFTYKSVRKCWRKFIHLLKNLIFNYFDNYFRIFARNTLIDHLYKHRFVNISARRK